MKMNDIKKLIRNPVFYYVAVPAVMLLWPLMVEFVYIPKIQKELDYALDEYKRSSKLMDDILELDPERLKTARQDDGSVKFDYVVVVDQVAKECGIRSDNYSISTKPTRTVAGVKVQNAAVVLKETDITSFAKFLSTLQMRWDSLQCEKLKLTGKKDSPDAWKVDMDLKYYY